MDGPIASHLRPVVGGGLPRSAVVL